MPQPNILLITTDQQRGDCLGIDGHPCLQTPNLDHLARSGTRFRRAYAESPTCIPARRSLLTGTSPAAHGMIGMQGKVPWNPAHTLPGELSRAGYQSVVIGKLHLYPHRKRFGFDHMIWADATRGDNDYTQWLVRQGAVPVEGGYTHGAMAHGATANGWIGRPHTLPEDRMFTFWAVSQSLDFLHKRDPSCPFFLNVSLIDPHPPLTPPAFYYDRYIHDPKLPMPVVGDWAPSFDRPQKGLHIDASELCLDERQMRCTRAAYYGMINFIDDQIGRLLYYLSDRGVLKDTLVLFTSDHGEMLGDHHLFRKGRPFEGSARVPLLVRAPETWDLPASVVSDAPAGLQDVMPTLLEAAGVPVPATCTGRSLLPLVKGQAPTAAAWRDALHGEDAGQSAAKSCLKDYHSLVSDQAKYIWFSGTGQEMLFDLVADPQETHNLACGPDAEARLAPWRQRMIQALSGRPEGFTDGRRLIAGRPHGNLIPGYTPEYVGRFE